MNLKNTLSILLCLLTSSSFAQTITGKINASSGQAVGFANISVLNSSDGTTADKAGNFSLELSNGKYQLQVSAIGYATKIQPVTVANQPQTVVITLTDNANALSEVVVTADKTEERLQNYTVGGYLAQCQAVGRIPGVDDQRPHRFGPQHLHRGTRQQHRVQFLEYQGGYGVFQ